MGELAPDADTKRCPQCAEHVGRHAAACPYCRYRFDRGRPAARRAPAWASRLLSALVLVALAAGVAVWTTGALDRPLSLYQASINAHVCYRSASGVITCGGSAQPHCSASTAGSPVPLPGSQEKCFGGLIDQRDTLVGPRPRIRR